MASEAQSVLVRDLVLWLTALEEDHLDHGRRLQAEGVRSAITAVQRNLQTHSIPMVDGTSAGHLAARNHGEAPVSYQGKPGSP